MKCKVIVFTCNITLFFHSTDHRLSSGRDAATKSETQPPPQKRALNKSRSLPPHNREPEHATKELKSIGMYRNLAEAKHCKLRARNISAPLCNINCSVVLLAVKIPCMHFTSTVHTQDHESNSTPCHLHGL